jgi:ribosome-binding ATPase YchF (GTP1/OBG family)
MEARIIGLKGSGKSTLMAALAGGRSDGTITTVRMGDDRIRRLSELFKPRKTTFAEFRVREAAWPEASARKAQMERYLDQLAGGQVFLHVLRAFESPMLAEPADIRRDLQTLDAEFVFADLMIVERAMERSRKQPLPDLAKNAFVRCLEALEDERPLRDVEFSQSEVEVLKTYQFLTLVPQIVVVNLESGSAPGDAVSALLGDIAHGRQIVAFPFPEAAEVAELTPAEQLEFAEAMGLPGPAAEIVSHAAFSQMGLISFFTVGEDEVRAWPVRQGERARRAAGAVHSDIERGFIRAEVVDYETLIKAGSLKACRDQGSLRIEGKDYVVADGDIVHFRFNV